MSDSEKTIDTEIELNVVPEQEPIKSVTEIAYEIVKKELDDIIPTKEISSWIQLVTIICETVDKQNTISGSEKKDIAISLFKLFISNLGISNILLDAIIETLPNVIDEIITISKGVYAINQKIKKSNIVQKLKSLCRCGKN